LADVHGCSEASHFGLIFPYSVHWRLLPFVDSLALLDSAKGPTIRGKHVPLTDAAYRGKGGNCSAGPRHDLDPWAPSSACGRCLVSCRSSPWAYVRNGATWSRYRRTRAP